MEGGLLLDVVIRKGASILKLLSSENETLLIRWDTFLVLDLGLDVVDSVRWLDIKGNGLSSKGLDENLCMNRKNATVSQRSFCTTTQSQPT